MTMREAKPFLLLDAVSKQYGGSTELAVESVEHADLKVDELPGRDRLASPLVDDGALRSIGAKRGRKVNGR